VTELAPEALAEIDDAVAWYDEPPQPSPKRAAFSRRKAT
jgi:hypothetical protein